MGYTNASLIEAELRAAVAFADTTTPSLSQVTTWIEEESAQIDRDSGYTLESKTYDDYYDITYDEDKFFLKVSPVISVNSVLYATLPVNDDNYSNSWELKTEDTDYLVYDERGYIEPIYQEWEPKTGKRRLRINYTAGESSTPLTIQKLATKMVALRVLDSLIKFNVNDENAGGSISVGSISIVEPDNLSLNTIKELKSDIEAIKGDITKGFGVHRYNVY